MVNTKEGKGAEGSGVEIENNSGDGILSNIEQVLELLESGTDCGRVLSSLIDTVHQAIMTGRKIRKIEDRLEEIERRLELVEKEYASMKKVAQRSKKENLKERRLISKACVLINSNFAVDQACQFYLLRQACDHGGGGYNAVPFARFCGLKCRRGCGYQHLT